MMRTIEVVGLSMLCSLYWTIGLPKITQHRIMSLKETNSQGRIQDLTIGGAKKILTAKIY
jgi:hypothetical protein